MKYFANTSWLFSGKIAQMFIILVVGVLVTRHLGPEKYGLLSYAISFTGLFSILTTLGLNELVIKGLINEASQKEKYLGTAFCLRFFGAIVSMLSIVMFTFLLTIEKDAKILIFVLMGASLFQGFTVIDLFFQSKVLSKYVIWSQLISLTIASICKVVFIILNVQLIYFAIITALQTVITVSGLIFFYLKTGNSFRIWNFDWVLAKSLIKDAFPLMLAGIAVVIYMRIDQVMLKSMVDSIAVGEYAAAVKLSEAWYFIPVAIASSLFPAILNAKKKDQRFYEKRLQQFYTIMVWIAITIALPFSLISEFICNMLFGAEYVHTGKILSIHIWAIVFTFVGVASGRWLIAEGYYKYSFYRTTLGAITNVGLNVLLIPKSAGIGAAWATLISYGASAFLLDIFILRLHGDLKRKILALSPRNIYFIIKNSLRDE